MDTQCETTLDVSGMSCPSCIRHIDDALSELDGVHRVEVRISDGKVLVRHDPNRATADRMLAALREAGYDSSVAATHED